MLSGLLSKLKKDPHIRTNELEKIFKDYALQNGVIILHEEVKPSTIHQQVAQSQPDMIIGADGTHSTVSKSLFPAANQVKIEFDYVLQTRYEVKGEYKAKAIAQKDFVRDFIHHGVIANEYVGAFDEKKNKTPVTMQMMISKDAFEKLQLATSKHPIQPLANPEQQHQQHTLALDNIPDNVRNFLKTYIEKKTKIFSQFGQVLDPTSLTFSVNEAPATYAKQPINFYDDTPVILVGDAALGLSYFKGLNAGLESTAQLLTLLTACIQSNFENHEELKSALENYTHWFLNDFSPKKIKEVERYSTVNIRLPEKAMHSARSLEATSGMQNIEYDDMLLLDYLEMLALDLSSEKLNKVFPHREFDPTIKFAQLTTIPVSYTLNKTLKVFRDYVKPYKYSGQWIEDSKQPLLGLANTLSGLFKAVSSPLSGGVAQAEDGIANVLRGALEIVTSPISLVIKPILRSLATSIQGKPKIEENKGLKRIAQLGLEYIEKEDFSAEIDSKKNIYALLAISHDIHRKFLKSLKRGQDTNLGIVEATEFAKIKDKNQPRDYELFNKYFSIFSIKSTSVNQHASNTYLESSLKRS